MGGICQKKMEKQLKNLLKSLDTGKSWEYTYVNNKDKELLDMKSKWYRRVGGKHVKFNLSKSGITTSFKLGPITINPQRNSYFIRTGIPGLSLRGKLNEVTEEAEQNESKIELQRVDKGIPVFEIFIIAFFILMIL